MPSTSSTAPRAATPVASPDLVAHRGVHDEVGPGGGQRENTLAAVRAAVDAGASLIEVDVQLTRDGAVVLLHDDTLERLWGDPRPVTDVDLAEVRELGGGDRRIPLLAEALEIVRGSAVGLLVDMDAEAPAAPAAAVVRAAGAGVRTAWCGELVAMRTVRRELPDAEIWLPWREVEPPGPADLAELAPAVVNMPHLLVGERMCAAVHRLGARVSCWTVDEPAQAAWLAAIGVDSITTNRLARVRDALDGPVDERARLQAVISDLAGHAASRTSRARADGAGPVETKTGPADHVTEVDRAIERGVRDVLGAQYPDHAVVGEEYGGAADGERPCWYVDPVDGTANLANGVPWTSFSLALVDGGRPVAGAVLDPVGPVPVVATRGGGAWRGARRLRLEPLGRPDSDPLAGAVVTTELAGAQPWPGMDRFLALLAARHCTLRIPGSGTATLAGVALGRGVAALVHRFSPIDHAAAVLVVEEAGGVVLDATGARELLPDGPVVVGRDERTARALLDVWHAATAGVPA